MNKNNTNKDYVSLIVEALSKIVIKLVQINNLNIYEVAHWLLTIFVPSAIGFWVGYYSATIDSRDVNLRNIALVFTFFSLVFLVATILLRWQIHKNTMIKSIGKSILEIK